MTGSSYEMFTDEGNRAVERVVGIVTSMIEHRASERACGIRLDEELARVARAHPEVNDTAVRDAIYTELERVAGHDFVELMYELVVQF